MRSSYLGTRLANQNFTDAEIKSRRRVQNLLPSNLLQKNTRWFKYDRDYLCLNKSQFVPVIFEPPFIKIKTSTIIIFPIVLYGWETWSPILREEYRSVILENRVMRRILGPKTEEVKKAGESRILKSFRFCIPRQILFWRRNHEEWKGRVK